MPIGPAIAGWIVATLAVLAAIGGRRMLVLRMEMVARASHELRGPLTATRLGLRLGDLSPQRLRAIDLELDRATLALEDLVGIVSRSAPERVRERVDIKQLVADSAEVWRAAATASGAQLSFEWSGPASAVHGDRVRLAQAVGNLIANAIEHGGGRISIRGTSDERELRIELTDGGPGLPAPVAELVAHPGRRSGARGRGLAITDSIVRAHGGRLASGPSERGARLVLSLPAAAGVVEPSCWPVG